MTIIHGRKITAQEIENIVSREFSDKDFASLCNAVTWASSGHKYTTLPSFTERVNVKDGGIDAEWTIEMSVEDTYKSPLFGPGWNVFQFKRRDIFAQGREETFKSLRNGLKEAIKELVERTGRRPNRYVLFVNLDLTHETKAQSAANPQIRELEKALLKGYDEPENIHVEIVDAGLLSAFLNNLPHLRSAYFATSQFSSWQKFSDDHTKQKKALFGEKISLVGRNEELTQLQSLLENPNIRAIILSGPHNIGKTRLAIEATTNHPINTVVALDPRSFTVSDMLKLKSSPGIEIILIIEDPDPILAEKIVDQTLAEDWLKLLLTFPTAEDAPKPNLGRDERVKNFTVSPLTHQQSEELLEATEAQLDYALQTWIVEQSGGNPGVLLLAASLGPNLRKDASSFVENVAKSFEDKTRRIFGDNVIQEISLLSLLTHVGIRGRAKSELEAICSIFGDGIQLKAILNHKSRLINAGVLQERGSYVEVLPPLFASRLTANLIQGRTAELITLFAALEQSARIRLLNRLNSLPNQSLSSFWDQFFGENGLFIDLGSIRERPLGYLFRPLANAIPEKIAWFIEISLEKLTIEERLNLVGEARGNLRWVLDDLLFHAQTSFRALRCLAWLAEAETENYGNNATGVFCKCFTPLHPQLPLSLNKRQQLLAEFLDKNQPTGRRLIAVKAIEQTLSRQTLVTLRRSSGAKPLDSGPSLTNGQIWDYIEALVQLLMAVVESETSDVSDYIWNILPRIVAEATFWAPPDVGTRHFETLVDWALMNRGPISISRLVGALDQTVATLNSYLGKYGEEDDELLSECIGRLQTLANQLYEESFAIRLQIWVEDWVHLNREYVIGEDGQRIYRGDQEIQNLAREAIDNSTLLTSELLVWLCSSKAKKARKFFFELGKLDLEKHWLGEIERVAKQGQGEVALPSYYGGLSTIDPGFVSNRLDTLVDEGLVSPETIIRATHYFQGDLVGVKRAEKLIAEEGIDPVYVANTLSTGGWIATLSDDEFLRLLKAIAGKEMKYAMAVIDSLGMWLHHGRTIEGEIAELAWKHLEVAQLQNNEATYDCNELASYLTKQDPEQGFQLFERLLTDGDFWNPIDQYGHNENKFWRSLVKLDQERAFKIILNFAFREFREYTSRSSNIHELINADVDTNFLVDYTFENEAHAMLVANSINTKRQDFWDIALRMVEKYPNNLKIREGLSRGITRMGWGVIESPFYKHYEKCRQDVERVLHDPATPPQAHPWLQQLCSKLTTQINGERVSEEDEAINYWRHSQWETSSLERTWAIETLQKLGRKDLVEKLESLSINR